MNKIYLNIIDYKDIDKLRGKFDWIVFVYVETATCTKFDIKKIRVRVFMMIF